LRLIKTNHKITNSEYQLLNKISRETSTRDLKKLIALEIFKDSGVKGAGALFYTKIIAS
jgi:predicted HTH transcriptional regulator